MPNSEKHPLAPFLPCGARLLMLGSFPPPRKRWSMEFFYPNLQNDMWRIIGHLATGDKLHFLNPERRFDRDRIVQFCTERGIALYDAASEVRRLMDNASDRFLEVVTPTDIEALLLQIPACEAIVTTGQKATDQIVEHFGCVAPAVGGWTEVAIGERRLRFWRMPSSSRAYPMRLEAKAEIYARMFGEEGYL